MGLLVDGKWVDRWYDTESTGGSFQRQESAYRNWITADAAGDDSSNFRAAPDRYHLYVSLACPWAHRCLILRKLKGLEDVISVSIVDPFIGEHGWYFSDAPGCIPDTVNGKRYLYEVYQLADPGFTGRVTTPTLWDKQQDTIVNNESAEIIRMLNSAFDEWAQHPERDYYPQDLQVEIDGINAEVYPKINNGVYKAGFATSQAAYEQAAEALFEALDKLEERLSTQRYLVGTRLTEADWRLFTTLIRFDAVYFTHFKCNLRRLADYAHLSGYLRDLYQTPGVAETVNLEHIRRHYYTSHETVNPHRIVPIGPMLDFDSPHGREGLQ